MVQKTEKLLTTSQFLLRVLGVIIGLVATIGFVIFVKEGANSLWNLVQ